VLTEAALTFITRHKDKPFFCYIPYNAPHGPFQVPDQYFDYYKAKGLTDKDAAVYGMVENMDENIGRLLQKLDELKLSDNTIVVFLTDNGPNGERFNGQMKGVKGSVNEGGVRVPLFIRWPGRIKPGTVVKPIAAHIDLLPTLAALTGIATSTTLPVDGVSLVPLLKNEKKPWPKRALYTHVLGTDTLKQVKPYPGAVRTAQYRFIRGKEGDLLYDMLADSSQQRDIARQKPEVARDLRNKYDQWFAEVTKEGLHPEVTQVGYSEAPVVELFAPDATLKGQVRYYGKNGFVHDWATGWQQADDSMAWRIRVVKPGKHRIALMYNAPTSAVGTRFVVTASDQTITAPLSKAFTGTFIKSPNRTPNAGVPEREWATAEIGSLSLSPGDYTVKVTRTGDALSEPIEIKSLILEKLQ